MEQLQTVFQEAVGLGIMDEAEDFGWGKREEYITSKPKMNGIYQKM